MRISHLVISAFSLFLLGGIAQIAQSSEMNPAALQLTVLEENGAVAPSAHVYIFSKNKKVFFGTHDVSAPSSFELPAGDYLVYAAMTGGAEGTIDHYSSPELQVRLSAEEPTSIILPLRKAEDSEIYLTETARKKLGIDEELAKYLN